MKKFTKTILAILTITTTMVIITQNKAMSDDQKKPVAMPVVADGHKQITLGAGCFWCVEAIFNRLDGVISATSGFMGGTNPKPTYQDVININKNTGEVEVVHIVFDPKKISTEVILAWFWKAHDPTQADGQGADRGPQYLSTIFYHSDKQHKIATESKALAQKEFQKPIATRIIKAKTFHPGELYHQNFYRNNQNHGYCKNVIAPKLHKLKLKDKPDTGK